jgi:anaphase-promoting complex subunit 6
VKAWQVLGYVRFFWIVEGKMDLAELRAYAEKLFANNAYETCNFVASKLVTLSRDEPQDVFLLARSLHATDHQIQAARLLEAKGLLAPKQDDLYLRSVLLAVQCYRKAGRSDDVLKYTEAVTSTECENVFAFKREMETRWGGGLCLVAQVCLERGKAYEKLENRKRALSWLQVAVHLDVRCFEAFEKLIAFQLSSSEESSLLSSLEKAGSFQTPATAWMRAVFKCVTNRYDSAVSCEDKFAPAEALLAFPGGPTLAEDPFLASEKAELKYNQHDACGAYELTKKIISHEVSDFNRIALTHIAAMVDLNECTELFSFAHQQIKWHPKRALSWYAVAAYYFCVKKFGVARDYFNRATALDPGLLPAWIALAHSHALYDESDRAMAVYRTAARLFPGNHIPVIGTAMEYLRTNNLTLAEQFCHQALALCDADPALYNEMGVIYYRKRKYPDAVKCFKEAIRRSSGVSSNVWSVAFEHLYFNLGHALRRSGNLQAAIEAYEMALARSPKSANGRASLGLAYHISGSVDLAMEQYHVALGLRPNDTLLEELMDLAVKDVAMRVD